jgi:protoheme IX farnesyltransferase
MKVFNYSVVYLMMLFVFLLVDHYLPGTPVPTPGLGWERVG